MTALLTLIVLEKLSGYVGDEQLREFAGYGVTDPFGETLSVCTINPDGRETASEDCYSPDPRLVGKTKFLPIVKEEVIALGLGKDRWHGPGDFKIQVPAWFGGKD